MDWGKKNRPALRVIAAIVVAIITLTPVTSHASSTSFSGRDGNFSGGTVTLLHSDLDGIAIGMKAPAYQVRERAIGGNACSEIVLPGFATGEEPGRPRLPFRAVLLGVPPDAELSLEVTAAQTTQQKASLLPCPAPQTRSIASEDGTVAREMLAWAPAAEVYRADAFYPAQVARLVDLGFMRSQRIVRLELTPLQVNPATGEMRHTAQAQVRVNFHGRVNSGQAVEEPAEFETIFRNALLNYDAARGWRSATPRTAPTPGAAGPAASTVLPAPNTQPPATGAWLPPTPAYRIAVDSEGIYQLTYQDLVSATLPVTTIDPRTFKMYNLGQELAIQVIGEKDGRLDAGDAIIFYGRGVNTRYTTRNIYWLTYGGAEGKRMTDQASVAGGTVATSFTREVHIERNQRYVSTLPMQEGYDHWYDSQLTVLGGQTGGRNYSFFVDNLATGSYTATLEVMLGALRTGVHHLKLYVGQTGNLRLVHETTAWYDKTMYHTTVSFPQSYLVVGSNVVRVEIVNGRTTEPEIIYPDWFHIGYQRAYNVTDDYLAFGGDQAGQWRFELSGFTTDEVDVYDVTDPAAVKRIGPAAPLNKLYLPFVLRNVGGSATVTGVATAPAATFAFGANQTGPRRYVALTAAKRKAPLSVQAAQAPDNLLAAQRADYLMISHPDFLAALDPLVRQRTAQGLQVKKINVQDVYDQFGYGMWSAEAIQAFLAHAYSQWNAPKPSYVLLVGDGNYDLRRYLGTSGPTYLPPYLAMIPDDPDTGESAADNRFVTITAGDLLPDMHIGRFPVNSVVQATTMVDKAFGYENAPASGTWTQRVLFVTDDLEGGGGDFYAYSNLIADGYADPPTNTVKYLPTPYTATKIYMGPSGEPRATCPKENPSNTCRQNTINEINAGALMVSYIGHGTKTDWASERIMDLTALTQLTNNDKLTIMLPMTCDNGYFAQANADAFGEVSVRMAAGAIASWSPTGFGLASGHDLMERGLFLAVFQDRTRQLGAATTAGKVYLVQNAAPGKYLDLLDTYILLGDPALRVPLANP